jgi:putative flippase GtrA
MMASSARERVRFVRFATVGAVGAALDVGVMNLLTRFGHLQLVAAGTLSFAVAVISNFLWNRHWTYPDSRSRHVLQQLGMFAAVNLAGVAMRIPILHFLEPPMRRFTEQALALPARTADILAKNLTLGVAIGIVMLWNFFVNRYWTYSDVDAGLEGG